MLYKDSCSLPAVERPPTDSIGSMTCQAMTRPKQAETAVCGCISRLSIPMCSIVAVRTYVESQLQFLILIHSNHNYKQ